MTIARSAKATHPKSDRLELRLDPTQRRLLAEAAAANGVSVSAFVLDHATEAARDVLADRTTFVLPDERWDAFVDLIERDARPSSKLASFLARPSALDRE